MPGRGRRMGSDATTLREDPPQNISSDATVSPPTESEIAAIAYRLWVHNGCPDGSDQEDWFRAEAMLCNALVAKCEELSKETRNESEILVEFRWEGHWEAWEREWGGAHWVWDLGRSAFEVSNRAGWTDPAR
jgi:hypothetical protein